MVFPARGPPPTVRLSPLIATPLYGKLGLSEEEARKTSEAILGQIPAARFGQPSEVAKAIVFLASDESRSRSAAS